MPTNYLNRVDLPYYENGRPTFAFRALLASSIYTQEEPLGRFLMLARYPHAEEKELSDVRTYRVHIFFCLSHTLQHFLYSEFGVFFQ